MAARDRSGTRLRVPRAGLIDRLEDDFASHRGEEPRTLPAEDELAEPGFADKPILLEVNATLRPESFRELLASVPELSLLRTKAI